MYPVHEEELKNQIEILLSIKNKNTKEFTAAARNIIKCLNPRHRMLLKRLNMMGPRPIADDVETSNSLIKLGLAVKVVWRSQLSHVASTELGYDVLMSFRLTTYEKIIIGVNR